MNKLQGLSLVFTALGLLVLSPRSASAADAKAEIITAALHAGFAAMATDLPTAQKHLHHVMNCLIGPGGAEYDASAGNPCKDQGAGAIPDSDVMAQPLLMANLATAKQAAAQSDLIKIKESAAALQASLNKSAGK